MGIKIIQTNNTDSPLVFQGSVFSRTLRRRATVDLLAFILRLSLVLARPTHQHGQLLVQVAPDLCRRGQEPARPVTHRSPLRRPLLARVLAPKSRVQPQHLGRVPSVITMVATITALTASPTVGLALEVAHLRRRVSRQCRGAGRLRLSAGAVGARARVSLRVGL